MDGTRITTEASTLTVLFTDLVRSTELLNDLGDDEATRVFDEHFQILRAAAADHGGTEVKNLGDGLMLTFSSTAGGLACAASMQRRIVARNERTAGASIALRIGINAGEVTVIDHDYFGSPVVVAKRLCDRAEPGQALVSEIARTLVGSRGGYRFLDRGTLTLKGFPDPVKAFELDWRSSTRSVELLEHDEPGKAQTDAAEPPSAAGAPSLPAALIAEARGEIAGRVSELSILENDLARARRGELRLALVAGEPGIGKTRIAAELARIADQDGWEVLYGRCDAESLVPFQPFVEALAGHVARTPSNRLRSELGSNAAVLSRLLPEIAKRLPTSPAAPQSGDAETDRYLLFDATASLLRSLAAQQPLMLVLDDLHWADKPTLALLRELTRGPGATRMLVLGTYRDHEIRRDHPLSALIARRHRGAPVSVIGLSGLSEREVRAMIAAWGGRAPPPDFAHGVWRETEGQPFFVRELLRHLLETGAIFERKGQVSSELSIEAIGVPEGIKQLIESRLAMLNKETQRVLTIAAVVGREFAVDVLERVSEVSADQLLDLLEEAAAAGLVDSVAGAADLYSFAHALIRETLYNDLAPPRRIRLHRRIGDALEQLHPDSSSQRLPELAHHYFAAATGNEDLRKAIDYAVEAAALAAEQFAYEEAARHYERAVRALALRDDDSERRCELLLALGQSRWSAGDYAKAKQAFGAAADLAQGLGLFRQLALAALGYGGPMAFRAGVQDHALISLLERALAALPTEDSPLRARVMGHLGSALSFVPLNAVEDRDRGVSLGTEAVAMARRLGAPGVLAEVLSNTVVARSDPARFEEQLASTREAVALADEVGAAMPRVEGRVWLIAHLMEGGEIAAADAELDHLKKLVEELRQPYFVWLTEILETLRALHDGRIDDGDRLAWQALDTGQKAQNPSSIELFAAHILMIRNVQGRLGEIHAASAAITEHFVALPAFRCARAALCASLGLESQARAELDLLAVDGFARIPRDMFWLTSVDLLADTCSQLSDRARAAKLLELLTPFGDRNVLLGAVAAPRGIAARALGVLASTIGRMDDAERHFVHALEGNQRIGCLPGLAQTQLDYARMLVARGSPGDRRRADALARDAQELAHGCGMHGLERTAQAILDRDSDSSAAMAAGRRRAIGAVAQQLGGDTKAVLSVRGRSGLARMFGSASDAELERRFGSKFAQRAMLTALAGAFQPRMAFGFEGEIQLEFIHAGDERRARPADWWTIRVTGDKAVARRRVAAAPAVSLHISIPDFVRVLSGVVNPVTVWFENEVQIDGDVILGARLVEIFGGVAPFQVLNAMPPHPS